MDLYMKYMEVRYQSASVAEQVQMHPSIDAFSAYYKNVENIAVDASQLQFPIPMIILLTLS